MEFSRRHVFILLVLFPLYLAEAEFAVAGTKICSERVLQDGIIYRSIVKEKQERRNVIHILEVDLKKGYKLENIFALDRMMTKENVREMARRIDALAAVNASFFYKNGGTAGLVAVNGRLISEPVKNRTVFGLSADSRPFFMKCAFSSEIVVCGKSYTLDGINRPPLRNEVVLFTPDYGEKTPEKVSREYVVIEGLVIGCGTGGSTIPLDGFVLASHGNTWLDRAGIDVGQEIIFNENMPPEIESARLAVGGGPRLLENGKTHVSWKEEGFTKSFAYTPAPRTAIGATEDGRLIFVVVDGRQKGYSDGMSLGELSELMRELGAVDAVNMDGGGSTTLVIAGNVMNRPSDGHERAVVNSLAILTGEEKFPAFEQFERLMASSFSERREQNHE